MRNAPSETESKTGRLLDQYERFPYPSADNDLAPYADGQRMELGFPRFFYSKYWPCRSYSGELDILVVGCGTSQAARYAAAHPAARVTGIDVSDASLLACRKLIAQFGLSNIQLERLALQDVASLNCKFDLIVCSGVIHHLENPSQGLLALREALRKEGSLYLMVYARHGRDAIYYLQDLCRLLGLTSESISETDIGRLREFLQRLPSTHPFWQRKKFFPDLLGNAELVDYLLNPLDRAYTLGELADLLQECRLTIQSFMQRAHYSPLCCALRDEPFYESMRQRDQLTQYRIGELYRACLFKHELIVCRDDRPTDSYSIELRQTTWNRLIPVRTPGLFFNSVQPLAGMAGWLGWGGHHFSDIRLPLTNNEKRVLDAIDGNTSIAQLSSQIGLDDKSMTGDMLQEFLARLLEFDYIWLRTLT
jgi:SAM-dependent methyltransferase